MIYFVFFIGLLIGSFLNVCIYRLPHHESIAFPPSHCTRCETNLRPGDLVPVLSYLLARGKCRYCGEKISLQYPVIELLNAILYILFFLKYGFTIIFLKYAILASLLLVIAVIDYHLQIIPDECNLFGLIVSGAFIIFYNFSYTSLIDAIFGLLLGGGIFLVIALVSKGGMGGGDIKLMGVLGLALGVKDILLITFLSFIIGAVFSLFLLGFKLKKRKDPIAFGPFISVAALITMLYGTNIIKWYLHLILG
ncbi:type 4 prepilin peptidase 1 Aspartic peptidase. MEROPS family A24A [Desulfonispora thiosulfatigenes DSM 11270]|uniref:Prepilin leader peptidase/N-methyltransferase n=1 Tax=Desulfonispora thiosulfatigenes DSM 11270 TaxID=656914 RepID=A0A1W1VNM3_DESTI|nr:A24 family peptidase [Desulfonispora thiosulfatigenes]SMB94969.1 type 4 prepilin peptidase 1 Aspartic peptidase. MEROPS family A24A [Desulfonispora thiosulfatigenes DSM 11270]